MADAMETLQLPAIDARIRPGKIGKDEIFDIIRKRWVRLTPEEWVRQHFLHYMTGTLGFPPSLIAVEAEIRYNNMPKRFDLLAYNSSGKPVMVVECKAPSVEITQAVFDQAAMYNMTVEAAYLAVTNGLTHYACRIDHVKRSYEFLREIPSFAEVNG